MQEEVAMDLKGTIIGKYKSYQYRYTSLDLYKTKTDTDISFFIHVKPIPMISIRYTDLTY